MRDKISPKDIRAITEGYTVNIYEGKGIIVESTNKKLNTNEMATYKNKGN
jgi:hypothetical protein